jgi:hypothetical protein
MIDQLVSGMPQPIPAKPASNDRQSAGSDSQDGGTETFGSLVSRAEQQQKKGDRDSRYDATDGREERPATGIAEAGARSPFELSVAVRKHPGSVDGRVRLPSLKDQLGNPDTTTTLDKDSISRLADKLKTTLKDAATKPEEPDVPAADELSPADELGLLLGLTSHKQPDGKTERKPVSGKDDDTDKKDGATAKEHIAKTEEASADHIVASTLAGHGHGQDAASDDQGRDRGAVRVVSADGRGRAVDIGLAKVTSEQTRDSDKPAAAQKVDTATVLEARRYLGFTQDTNATTLAHAVKADPGWTAALDAADRLDTATLGRTMTEVNTLKLQMNPENLGSMVASLRLKGEELTVELQVSTVEAYRHLSADHDDIVKALQDQGFTIDKVTVQLNAADRTDTGADRDMSRQGQMQREGQGGQSDFNNGRGGDRPGTTQQQDIARDVAPDDGAVGARHPGGVYL